MIKKQDRLGKIPQKDYDKKKALANALRENLMRRKKKQNTDNKS